MEEDLTPKKQFKELCDEVYKNWKILYILILAALAYTWAIFYYPVTFLDITDPFKSEIWRWALSSILFGTGLAVILIVYLASLIHRDCASYFKKTFFFLYGILIAAIIAFLVTDVSCWMCGYKYNWNTYPGYLGPGDKVFIQFPTTFPTLEKKWDGQLSVTCQTEDGSITWNSTIRSPRPLDTSGTIAVNKKSDLKTNTNFDGELRIPDRPDLENKLINCTIQGELVHHILCDTDHYRRSTSPVSAKVSFTLGKKSLGKYYNYMGTICATVGWLLILVFITSLKVMSNIVSRQIKSSEGSGEGEEPQEASSNSNVSEVE